MAEINPKFGKYLKCLFLSLINFTVISCNSPYNGMITDHYDGKKFFHGEEEDSDGNALAWFESLKSAPWPNWIEDPRQPIPIKKISPGGLRVTHINHATMLVQTESINILTDPIWSQRASIVSWIGPKRVRAPGVAMKDLPRIDMVLISHNHYDHLDIPTIKSLAQNHNPIILAGLGVGALLKSEGISNVAEMDWWQEYALNDKQTTVTFVPAKHHSGRGILDKNKTLWGGFVIESKAGRIYFAGDTAYGEFLSSIKEKFGEFRLALIPIGHYKPRWMMKAVHLNPDEAVMLHQFLNIRQSVGMHYSTFGGFGGHTAEKIDEPENDLRSALKKHGILESEFWLLNFGEGRDVSM